MNIELDRLEYSFLNKPLLIGGRAKEYYNIRKSGKDIDLVVSSSDFQNLSELFPENKKEIYGDLGVCPMDFEIWKTIRGYDYEFLSKQSIELEDMKIINLEVLLFLTAQAASIDKYKKDSELILEKLTSSS